MKYKFSRKTHRLVLFFVTLLALTFLPACEVAPEPSVNNSPKLTASNEGLVQYLECMPAIKEISKWTNPYARGLTITTAHYQIHTTLLDPLILRQLPAFMEAAHREYNKQLPTPLETKTLFQTYLFDNREQWESFTRSITGSTAENYLAIKKGAYYLNGACVAYNIGRQKTFSVLGHEGWHQFNSKHFTYRLPSWLDEGIATLFETFQYENGDFIFRPSRNANRLGALKYIIAKDTMFTVQELIVLNPGQVVHGESGEMMSFYAQSYALVRFLREEDYGIRLARYQSLLLDAFNGKWPVNRQLSRIARDRNIPLTVEWNQFISPWLFAYYLDDDIEGLQEEYRQFCNKIVYRVKLSSK